MTFSHFGRFIIDVLLPYRVFLFMVIAHSRIIVFLRATFFAGIFNVIINVLNI